MGEYFDKNLFFCIPCPRGTFSLVLYVEKCELCPNEADFCADSRIFLQNGYWRSNNFSHEIYKCLPISELKVDSSSLHVSLQNVDEKSPSSPISMGKMCMLAELPHPVYACVYRIAFKAFRNCVAVF